MNEPTVRLNVPRPARLLPEQVAQLLGFNKHDIPILIKAKLLKPLGNPLPAAVKYFAAAEIEKLAADNDWLNRATKSVYKYWADQNERRKPAGGGRQAANPASSLATG